MAELRRYRTMVSDSVLWHDFPFRDGDIVISCPPKCGTTWTQMLCALLIFDSADFYRPLTEISPWFDAVTYDLATTRATLEAQTHRRFIKTHTPLDGLPFHAGVTYICVGRDPRDVALSWDHAIANVRPEAMQDAAADAGLDPTDMPPPPADPVERFWLWADAEFANGPVGFGTTLANLVHHVGTFWDRRDEPQVALFHYQDLLTDLPDQLRQLAARLDIKVSDARAEELAVAAGFDRMRERADELAPGIDKQLWRSNRAFFRAGSSGQWYDVLGPEDQARYQERLAELAPPDVVGWLHTGWYGWAE